jgi:hypothetical protein
MRFLGASRPTTDLGLDIQSITHRRPDKAQLQALILEKESARKYQLVDPFQLPSNMTSAFHPSDCSRPVEMTPNRSLLQG